MKKFKTLSSQLPVFSWCEDIEESAKAQIENLTQLPFAFHHIAIMPDCHSGYGMPIGGVLATKNVVIPNAVGVDIGCGMCACKTPLTDITQDEIKNLFGMIRKNIPVGFNHREGEDRDTYINNMPELQDNMPICKSEFVAATRQLGTLGGGNHFIEIQKGSDGYIWIMIHSGSRNLGKKVCDYYNKQAKQLNDLWFSSVPKSADLAFLPLDTDIAQEYLAEMNFCTEFAFQNRKIMMDIIKDLLSDLTPIMTFDDMINIHHNYATMENHYGTNVLVHRKGATLAREGTIGIIPGSQGTASYIVEGLGNPESFNSCSHGAGRRMSRTKAISDLILQDEISKMDGIVHSIRNKQDLDEASGAYKDIWDVMESQKDLVKIKIELTPLGVIKG
jgi:tRNA-splicing ligase RtcB